MKNTKLDITHENNKIYLRFINPEFQKLGFADYTDELWELINSSKWRIKEKYIYSGRKSLHRTIMEYWYTKECCEKASENGFVIDHIDNDGFNCLYENLEFLSHSKNWHYKGNYYDKERVEKIPIAAVNIFKKKSGDKFQITIGFNVPLVDSQGQQFSKAFFVYDTKDYNLVLSDAVMLVESVGNDEIDISNLRCNHSRFEPYYYFTTTGPHRPQTGSIINVDGKLFIVQGNDFPVIHKIAPDNTFW